MTTASEELLKELYINLFGKILKEKIFWGHFYTQSFETGWYHIFRTIKHLLIRNLLYISEWRAHKTASSSAAALYGCKKYFINWSLSFQSRSIPVALPFPRETRAPPSRSLSLLSPSDHISNTSCKLKVAFSSKYLSIRLLLKYF